MLTANSTTDNVTGTFGSSKNADSAVIRLRHGASTFVFTGDAEGEAERSAIDNAVAHDMSLDRTTLLLGSHHGARTGGSNSQAWLDATRPQAIAYSARLASNYQHPQCEAVDRALETADTVARRSPSPAEREAPAPPNAVSTAIFSEPISTVTSSPA